MIKVTSKEGVVDLEVKGTKSDILADLSVLCEAVIETIAEKSERDKAKLKYAFMFSLLD